MSFKKPMKKSAAPAAALPAKAVESPAVIIARQAAALEKALRERDAARDQLEAPERFEAALRRVLEIELAEIRAANGKSGRVP